MQSISEYKMLYNMDRVNGDFRPITADVFITNFCNNNCGWCTYKRWKNDSGAYQMDLLEFKVYAERLAKMGVKGIILTGGGEPTINDSFDDICRYLEENQIHYGVNSNFNELHFFKPDYLKVSLDGYDEDSYEKVRGVRNYEKTCENIRAFAEWKREKSQNTNLGIQMVVTEPEDIMRFYEANCELPVDYISFRPVESTMGRYYHPAEEMQKASVAVRAVQELSKEDSRVVVNYKWDRLMTVFEECNAHWAQIAVDERGNVIYCCHKPYEIVGHITDFDIAKKYKEFKTDMSKCDVPCRMTAPNLFMKMIEEKTGNTCFI